MLDLKTGHLTLTAEVELGPATSIADLQRHFSGKHLRHEWSHGESETYWLSGLTIDQLNMALMLYFRNGRFYMAQIYLSDPTLPEPLPEAEDVAFHQHWLEQATGGQSPFHWGSIQMKTDPKSGFEYLTLQYAT